MPSSSIFDAYFVYQFIRKLVKPYEKWPAFKTGLMDKDGNIIVSSESRTEEQRKSFKYLDLLVLNVRKTLGKIPGGNSKIATYAAALYLLKESNSNHTDEEMAENLFTLIKETIANSSDTPAMDSAIRSEPPNLFNQFDSIRRKTPYDAMFADIKIFDVPHEMIMNSKYGKHPRHRYSKYVGDDVLGKEIRQYGLDHPKETIILRDMNTGEMVFFKKGFSNE